LVLVDDAESVGDWRSNSRGSRPSPEVCNSIMAADYQHETRQADSQAEHHPGILRYSSLWAGDSRNKYKSEGTAPSHHRIPANGSIHKHLGIYNLCNEMAFAALAHGL
jgi:hypothetical protein